MRKSIFIACFLCFVSSLYAQEKSKIKFGKITAADFEIVSPLIDSNVNAIVLSDIGSSEFRGNSQGWFSMIFKRHKRVKILSNKGFDAADISVYLYSNGTESEKMEDLSAQTYNLEKATIITTKLDPKAVFEEKEKRNLIKKKFTFPAVKAGSIIEYTYSIKSDFLFNLQPWEFQGEYPCLWSEYNVALPEFFNYVVLSQGYLNYDVKKNDESFDSYTVRENGGASSDRNFRIDSRVHNFKWGIKNVPAIKEESFVSTIANHISKLEFQLSEYRFPNQPAEPKMATWPKVTERFLESEDFGHAFTKGNGFLDDELKGLLKGSISNLDKAQRIYGYVRDHYTCTSTYGIRLGDQTSIKEVFKRKSGSVGEINLLLLAMLRHESIPCDPVILSLRSRGYVHPFYPLMERFNYLICSLPLEEGNLYLDASKPYLGFGKLPLSCYNGTAWVLRKESPYSIRLDTDSLLEKKFTTVLLMSDSNKLVGAFASELGTNESYQFREKMAGSSLEAYRKEIKKSFTGDMKVENLEIDSLKKYEYPVKLKYDLNFNVEEDLFYFNPMLSEANTKNPFSSATRQYPVEMPYTMNELYVLNMEIPSGYQIEELPKSVRYNLNEDEGLFEYLIAKSEGHVNLRCKIILNKANFQNSDYQYLRDFYSFIIQKQSEQIVFKKIK